MSKMTTSPRRRTVTPAVDVHGPGDLDFCSFLRLKASSVPLRCAMGLTPGLTGGHVFPRSKVPTSDDLR